MSRDAFPLAPLCEAWTGEKCSEWVWSETIGKSPDESLGGCYSLYLGDSTRTVMQYSLRHVRDRALSYGRRVLLGSAERKV